MLLSEVLETYKQGDLLEGLTLDGRHCTTGYDNIATLNKNQTWLWQRRANRPAGEVKFRTLFFPAESLPEASRKNLGSGSVWGELLNSGTLADHNPFWEWEGYRFITLEYGKPVGMIMDEYLVIKDMAKEKYIVYTKVILTEGAVGFLLFETDNVRERPLELV